MTCKCDHNSHHAGHVSLVPVLHFAAQHQASRKTPCCIAIPHQHTVFSVATALCWMAGLFCCSAGLEDLQGCYNHEEEGRGSEAGASLLSSFLHCCLLYSPQSCRWHHHSQLLAGDPCIHSCMHPSIHASIHPFLHPFACVFTHSLVQACKADPLLSSLTISVKLCNICSCVSWHVIHSQKILLNQQFHKGKQLLHRVYTVGYMCPQVDMPPGLLPWTLSFFCQCASEPSHAGNATRLILQLKKT